MVDVQNIKSPPTFALGTRIGGSFSKIFHSPLPPLPQSPLISSFQTGGVFSWFPFFCLSFLDLHFPTQILNNLDEYLPELEDL